MIQQGFEAAALKLPLFHWALVNRVRSAAAAVADLMLSLPCISPLFFFTFDPSDYENRGGCQPVGLAFTA